MNDEILNLLIRVSKKVAIAKKELGIMTDKYPKEYTRIRESLNAVVDEMADFCKCPPTKLIFGKIEEIKTGLKRNCTL